MQKLEGEAEVAAEVEAVAEVAAAEVVGAVAEAVANRSQKVAAVEVAFPEAVLPAAAASAVVEAVLPEAIIQGAAVPAAVEAILPVAIIPGAVVPAGVAVHARVNADRHPHPEGISNRIDPARNLKGDLRRKTVERHDHPINEATIRKIARVLPRTGNRIASPSRIPIEKIGSNTAKINKRTGRTLPPTTMTTIMGGIMQSILWRQAWWPGRQ